MKSGHGFHSAANGRNQLSEHSWKWHNRNRYRDRNRRRHHRAAGINTEKPEYARFSIAIVIPMPMPTPFLHGGEINPLLFGKDFQMSSTDSTEVKL